MGFAQFVAIGLIVLSTKTWGVQQGRALPPTPQQRHDQTHTTTPTTQPSLAIEVIKQETEFMINEFKEACESNISVLNSIRPAPQKPDSYGTSIPFYTAQDKAGLISNLKTLIANKTNAANTFLSELEAKDKAQGEQLTAKEIMSTFIKISGTLNEGRKNCALSLSQLEKQELKTETLKTCSAANQKDLTKPAPGKDQAKTEQKKGLLSKIMPKSSPKSDSSAKSRPKPTDEEKQKALHEALIKSGLM
jgi:hypothetical protein